MTISHGYGRRSGTVLDLTPFNVKDFGAVGDGTTDDSVPFQAALDAVWNAGGGTLYVPDGTYAIGTPLDFTEQGRLNLMGNNRVSTKILYTAATGSLLDIGSSGRIRMQSIWFAFSNTAYSGTLIDGDEVTTTDGGNWHIEDCMFGYTTQTGTAPSGIASSIIYSGDGTIVVRFYNCIFSDYGTAIRVRTTHDANNLVVRDCYFAGGYRDSIFDPGLACNITGNVFQAGVMQDGYSHVRCVQSAFGLVIEGNYFETGAVTATKLLDIRAHGGSIGSNWFGNPNSAAPATLRAISLVSNCHGLSIQGNCFGEQSGTGTFATAIDFEAGTTHEGIAIQGNQFNKSTNGVHCQSTAAAGVTITGNRFGTVTNNTVGTGSLVTSLIDYNSA